MKLTNTVSKSKEELKLERKKRIKSFYKQRKRNQIKQDDMQRKSNSRAKSTIRTANKKVIKLIDSKEEKDILLIQKNYVEFVKLMDTASRKGIIHKKTAARKKSRLAKKINKLQVEQG